MRVAINAVFWAANTTGSGQYLRNLLRALVEWRHDTEYLIVLPHYVTGGQHDLSDELSSFGEVVSCTTPFDHLSRNLAKLWFEQVTFPRLCRVLDADIGFVPYFAPPLVSRVPIITTIHDLIPLILPQYGGSLAVRGYMRLVSLAARRAKLILTDSQASKVDIIRLLGIPQDRIRAILLAVDTVDDADEACHLTVSRTRLGLPDNYLLYFGGFDARKSVPLLLKAFSQARAIPGFPRDMRLVIAGRLPNNDTGFTPDPRRIARELDIEDEVFFTGWISDADKRAVYSGATVFLFPSQYEGFGLPVLEALGCGIAVIVADSSSLPEVVGNAGVLVSSFDSQVWAENIADLVMHPERIARLAQLARVRVRDFRWGRTAEATWQGFRDITAGSSAADRV